MILNRTLCFFLFIRLIIIEFFCFLCHGTSAYSGLIFTIQHILTIFFFLNLSLNLSSFCSLLCSFTNLPPHFRVKVLSFIKHNSPESSTSKARFRKFSKHLSIYPLFIRCVQEKQFC